MLATKPTPVLSQTNLQIVRTSRLHLHRLVTNSPCATSGELLIAPSPSPLEKLIRRAPKDHHTTNVVGRLQ